MGIIKALIVIVNILFIKYILEDITKTEKLWLSLFVSSIFISNICIILFDL